MFSFVLSLKTTSQHKIIQQTAHAAEIFLKLKILKMLALLLTVFHQLNSRNIVWGEKTKVYE